MHVKGTAFLSRKMEITKLFGEQCWMNLMTTVTKQIPFFKNGIIATTKIPLGALLSFEDIMIETVFDGDQQWFWHLGISSAEWALIDGPYKTAIEDKTLESFISVMPQVLWSSYYDFGSIKVTMSKGMIEAKLSDLPVMHPQFELTVMAFIYRAFQLLGVQNLRYKKLPNPDFNAVHYQFIGSSWQS